MSMGRDMRARLASLLVLFVVLGSGFVLGLAWDRSVIASPSEDVTSEDDGREDGDRRERRLIVEQVGLTPAQKSDVDSIVEFHRERLAALQDEVQPRYRAIIEDTRESLKEVLTPEQRVQYDSLLAEHDRKREERRRKKSEEGRR